MSARTFPIACREPLHKPLTADDGIAAALSVIRGRIFGSRSAEVRLVRLMIEKTGFEIRPSLKDVGSLATLSLDRSASVLRP